MKVKSAKGMGTSLFLRGPSVACRVGEQLGFHKAQAVGIPQGRAPHSRQWMGLLEALAQPHEGPLHPTGAFQSQELKDSRWAPPGRNNQPLTPNTTPGGQACLLSQLDPWTSLSQQVHLGYSASGRPLPPIHVSRAPD